MTAMNSPAQRLHNATANATAMHGQWTPNAVETPLRTERTCACGCGACFIPKRNSQMYINPTHRNVRYVEDKKGAVFNFVYELLRQYGASLMTAVRKAQEARDHYFNHWCKCLVRCGYVYDPKLHYFPKRRVWELTQ